MASYRILSICNGQKVKLKYYKDTNLLDIVLPDGEVISGFPINLLDQLDTLQSIIRKMVPDDKLEESGLDISERSVSDDCEDEAAEKKPRHKLIGEDTNSVVEAIADSHFMVRSLREPSTLVRNGVSKIQNILTEFRPGDAADLLDDMTKEATEEFGADIADWAIKKRGFEIATRATRT
jgi:hypothetical protein